MHITTITETKIAAIHFIRQPHLQTHQITTQTLYPLIMQVQQMLIVEVGWAMVEQLVFNHSPMQTQKRPMHTYHPQSILV